MNIRIEEMTIQHYEQVIALWRGFEGVGLSHDDSKENISRFLSRNPGMSLVAFDGDCLVGAVLCGHDGRRGYIHHLAVDPIYQKKGYGKKLVDDLISEFRRIGVHKIHLFIEKQNEAVVDFYSNLGWQIRNDLIMMSYIPDNTLYKMRI